MTVTLYTRPGCVECIKTKAHFASLGVSVRLVDVSQDAGALDRLRAAGYRSLPVVETPDGQAWAGHQPDRIRAWWDWQG